MKRCYGDNGSRERYTSRVWSECRARTVFGKTGTGMDNSLMYMWNVYVSTEGVMEGRQC